MDWKCLTKAGHAQPLSKHLNDRPEYSFRDFHRRFKQPPRVTAAVTSMDSHGSAFDVARLYLHGVKHDTLQEPKIRSAIRHMSEQQPTTVFDPGR